MTMKQQYESPSVTVILTEPETVMATASATDMDVPVINTEETHEPEEALSRPWLLTILLLLLPALTALSQTIGEAFYIYRNDGQFNAFFRNEIDSMAYSNYDADSVYCDEVVTQVVYTPDSIYRIPLAAIDSVGFVTPETVYLPGVIKLEGEIRKYVIRQDSLTIFFNNNTPTAVLPHVGDKLVTTEMDDTFPVGFAGEVLEIKNKGNDIEVVCTAVGLTDIFEYYYGVSQVVLDGEHQLMRKVPGGRRKASKTFAPGKLTLSLLNDLGFTNSYQPNDELSFDLSELKADISVTPEVWGSGIVTVTPEYGVYVSLTVTGKYDLEENFSLKGGLSWKKDITLPDPYDRIFWPIAPLVDVYLKPGVFVQAAGQFAMQQKWTQQYRSAFHWEYSSMGMESLQPVNKMIPVSSNHSGEAALKGNIGAGFFLEVGFDFIHTKKLDIGNVNLRGEAGVNLEGNLVLTKSDMESAKTSTAVYEQLRDTELSLNWFYGVTANAKFLKWGVSHDVNLGKIPLNNQGKIFSCAMAPTFSDVKAEWSKDSSSTIDAQAKVSCPALLGGRCIISDVGLVLKCDDGEDVARSYGIYDYNGAQGTKDLYCQFYDVEKGGKYKVYPHIKWMGVDILASPYAEVKSETSCPDSNHPHMIDLGLPSGTKWACCNVGAHSPEEYGNYYAWGETSPKSWYEWDTYAYYNSNTDEYVSIGSDISGTSYDAATANWGAPWCMPSRVQIQELLNYCSSTWTTQNGVNGRKFVGSNGGAVFIPAAGLHWGSGLHYAGSGGGYWSSTLDESDSGSAYELFFDSDFAGWGSYGGDRGDGRSVRPVR